MFPKLKIGTNRAFGLIFSGIFRKIKVCRNLLTWDLVLRSRRKKPTVKVIHDLDTWFKK